MYNLIGRILNGRETVGYQIQSLKDGRIYNVDKKVALNLASSGNLQGVTVNKRKGSLVGIGGIDLRRIPSMNPKEADDNAMKSANEANHIKRLIEESYNYADYDKLVSRHEGIWHRPSETKQKFKQYIENTVRDEPEDIKRKVINRLLNRFGDNADIKELLTELLKPERLKYVRFISDGSYVNSRIWLTKGRKEYSGEAYYTKDKSDRYEIDYDSTIMFEINGRNSRSARLYLDMLLNGRIPIVLIQI